jgi:haloacid dehalogenase-like hydrolase
MRNDQWGRKEPAPILQRAVSLDPSLTGQVAEQNLEPVAIRLTVLFDCDNTLLNNDAAKAEFQRRLLMLLGPMSAERFWSTYEAVRADRTVVDIPETIRRFAGGDEGLQHSLTEVFFDFPFADFVYPSVPQVIEHAREMGSAAILSDGDQVFQRHKIRQSGIEDLVGGAVYVFDHKEVAVPGLVAELKAERYVTVDDKPHLLTALRAAIGAPLTTVFVRQGKYANLGTRDADPQADFTLDSIDGFLTLSADALAGISSA